MSDHDQVYKTAQEHSITVAELAEMMLDLGDEKPDSATLQRLRDLCHQIDRGAADLFGLAEEAKLTASDTMTTRDLDLESLEQTVAKEAREAGCVLLRLGVRAHSDSTDEYALLDLEAEKLDDLIDYRWYRTSLEEARAEVRENLDAQNDDSGPVVHANTWYPLFGGGSRTAEESAGGSDD